MPQWEYKIIEVASGAVVAVDRQQVQSRPLLDTVFLNGLGEVGWELVSSYVDSQRSGSVTVLIFKRPRLHFAFHQPSQ